MKKFYLSFLFTISTFTLTAQTGTSAEVGITEGELSVSLTGGATYSIPIAVPPGINGVVPQVGLVYNSQGGNGQAGYGWNISGISYITRIPSTSFHDGTIDPVDFDSFDRFAFDGQRLMIKSGTTGTYGANGTVYETENFSNVKITSLVGTSGQLWFKVEYPDGSVAKYGAVNDSSTNMVWGISSWENPQGVQINYAYNIANNNLNIATIKYGTLGATPPINTVQFNYATAKHPEQSYIGGQNIINNSILDNITVTGNGVGFRSYVMGYGDTSLRYQRLLSITEKSSDGTKSYNPTVFYYDDTASSISYTNTSTRLDAPSNTSAANTGTVMGDFDGDGSMDFVLYPTTGVDAKNKFKLYTNINNSSSLMAYDAPIGNFKELFASTWLTYINTVLPQQGITAVMEDPTTTNIVNFKTYTKSATGINLQYTKSITFPFTQVGNGCNPSTTYYCTTKYTNVFFPKKYISGDFNGDGLTDVMAIDIGTLYSTGCLTTGMSGTVATCATGSTTTLNSSNVYFVDLKRDLNNTTPLLTGVISTLLKTTSDIQVIDFNGDGKSDFLIRNDGRIDVYSLDNNNNQLQLLTSLVDAQITLKKKFLLGDYNGDGKIDFLISKNEPSTTVNTEWYIYSSTGTNFTSVLKNFTGMGYTSLTPNFGYQYIPNDMNNDGKTDLVYMEFMRPANTVASNVGTLRASVIENINGDLILNSAINYSVNGVINVDANGLLNLFYSSNQNNRKLEIATITSDPMLNQRVDLHYFQSTKDFSKEKLLKSITTGNGVKETITYRPMQNGERDDSGLPIYQSASIAVYPEVDIQIAPTFQVVSKLEKQSASNYKKQLFSYYGAVSNMSGLGFLGFQASMRTNWYSNTNTIVSSISKFDISLRGANVENYTIPYLASPTSAGPPSNFTTKSVLGYNTAADALQANKVFKLTNTSSQQYNGLDNTSSETTTIYDTYSNPTQSTTILKQAGTTQQTTVSNLTYDNLPSATPYVTGRPNNKKQSVAVTGSTMTTEEQYIYGNSLLTDVKKFAGTDYISEHNDYDTYGNILQKIITYPGLTARKTSYTYDPSGRFLKTSTDIEGLSTSYIYNTNGTLKSETNPYNLTTSYDYDVWFKKIKTTDYLGKSATIAYTRNGVNSTITTTGDDGSVSEDVFDELGRKTRSGVKNVDGTFSYVSYLYDIYDRKVKVSEPYNSTATQWNESQFDIYGRLSKSISFTGKTVSMTYTGLVTKVDDGIKTKESTKDAIGNVISMTDTPGGTINYTYFANGNLKNSEYGGVNTTIVQDDWGRKLNLTDPSAGSYSYTYNGFGETLTESTPNGKTTYTRDPAVGKITGKKIETIAGGAVSTTIYAYDTATKLLSSTVFTDDVDVNKISTTYVYDTSKRISSTTEVTPYATFVKQFTYDAFGRVLNETSNASANGKSSNKTVQNTYKNGQLWQIIDIANSQVLWETKTVNARGQLTTASLGNTIAITNSYDTYGYINTMQHDLGTVNVMKHQTTFDVQRANLLTRNNSFFAQKETFDYDAQDRLTSCTDTKELLNNTFSTTDTEGYIVEGYQSISVSGGQLVIKAAISGDGVKKTFMNGASIGDVVTFSFSFNNFVATDIYNVYIQEKNPTTGAVAEYLQKVAVNGINTFTYTVTQYSTLVFKIIKIGNTALKTILLDNVVATTSIIKNQVYDDRGRITKNNIGDYNYKDLDPQKVYRNTSITVTPDALAYYTTKHDQIISYNVFKSPIQIEDVGIDKISFTYNDNNDRSAMFYGGLQDDKTLRQYKKYYSADGSMEIKVNSATPSAVEFVTYIGGDGYTAPVVVKSDGTTQNYLYLHRDYQGSILAITNQAGAVVEKRLFDAWGSIVKVQDGAGNALAGLTILDRGYTGHEHLQSVGLIHMNGRLYDPKLHRFLQPDNYVQDPSNTQSYNRYSYCWNNPLKYADYNGEWFGWDDLVVAAASFVIGYVSSGLSTGNWGASAVKAGAISAVTGWLAYNTAGISTAGNGSLNAAMGNFIVTQAAGAAVSYFMPPIGIQINSHWSFSISPAIAFGNTMGIGVNLSVTYSNGDFSFSGGIGIMSNSNYNGFGKNGMEIRKSILASYDDGKTGFSLGTNFWSGDFKQQTGVLGVHSGDFRAMYENDGSPFQKKKFLGGIYGDGMDRYRTAALSLNVGDFSAGFNLFTGSRTDYSGDAAEMAKGTQYGAYGEKMPGGFVAENGNPYRLGAAYVGYGNYRVGIDSDRFVRHPIQDIGAHWYLSPQPGFHSYSNSITPYFQYKASNSFTTW